MKLFIGCLLLMVYVLTLAYKGSLNAVLQIEPVDISHKSCGYQQEFLK